MKTSTLDAAERHGPILELTRFDGHGFMDSGHHEGASQPRGLRWLSPAWARSRL